MRPLSALTLLAMVAGPTAAQPSDPDIAVIAVDLDHDGAYDFTFGWSRPFAVGDVMTATPAVDSCSVAETASELSVHPAPGWRVAADGGVPVLLHPGEAVGPALPAWTTAAVILTNRIVASPLLQREPCDERVRITWHGPWGEAGEHALAVALDTPEGRRYGWIQLRLDAVEGHASLVRYALAAAPGAPAVVGE